MASASVISPNFTPQNINLNSGNTLGYLILTIFPEKERTIILLASFAGDKKGELFLDELSRLSRLDFEKIISSLLIGYSENTYFSPSLWNMLGSQGQKTLIEELNFITKMDKINSFFHSKINLFI